MQLRTAVAPQRAEHIPGQALRVHPDEHIGAVADVPRSERDVLDVVPVHVVGGPVFNLVRIVSEERQRILG